MAERKGSLIAKSVSKHAGRAKEKFLQNLGKVDRTLDDIFDEHLENFNRQQTAAARLQKEFNNYIRCIRAVQAASKSLFECMNDVYESGWVGQDMLTVQSQNVEMLWQDLSHKLADQVLLPLNTYYAQFPEMKKKIDKRSRKLVDYDGQRHNLQSLEGGGGKKRDETKIAKAKEQLQVAKRTYDTLNSELHDDLPALYHSRILFLVNNLQTLFSAEQVFHSETSKVYTELEAIIDKLATDSQKPSFTSKKVKNSPQENNINKMNSPGSPTSAAEVSMNSTTPPPSSPKESAKMNNDLSSSEPAVLPITPSGSSAETEPVVTTTNSNSNETSETVSTTTATTVMTTTANNVTSIKRQNSNEPPSTTALESSVVTANNTLPTAREVLLTGPAVATSPSPPLVQATVVNGNSSLPDHRSPNEANNNNKQVEELYDIPVGATTDNLPPGVMYRVKATYRYNREDVDELSFEVGEVIRVVQYDDPEEQEEGWLMGVKESTGEKGMFPANFTRPL